ncbi:MAG TPA: hypothetical protein VEG38_08360 [Acidimicrobiia bacterium]|nr:hypothetical protein [Acidimicrobiia bacterium]
MSALTTGTDWATGFERFVADDAEVGLVTRYSDFRALLEVGVQRYLLTVTGGRMALRPNPTFDDPWDFAVRGAPEAWDRLVDSDEPQYRDPLGMAFKGFMSVTGRITSDLAFEGNYQKLFANLQAIYAILSRIRPYAKGA